MNKLKLVALSSIGLLTLGSLATFVSCNKSNTTSVIETTKSTNPTTHKRVGMDDEELYDNIIKTVSYGLIDLSNNPSFREVVNAEISLQFDGDDNVLLSKLRTSCNEVGINLIDEMKNSLIQHGKSEYLSYVEESVSGFSYFDTKLYPQIFIPFIENKEFNHLPTIAMNFEDEPFLKTVKYSSSNIEESEFDEEKAKNNLVWVVSVNESVDEFGALPIKPEPVAHDRKYRGDNRVLDVYKIKVTEKKEGWGNGRADISFVAVQVKPNGCNVYNRQSSPLMKVADADISNGGNWLYPSATNCTACGDISLTSGGNNPYDLWEAGAGSNEEIPILFYELDVRKKFEKSEQLFNSCTNSVRKYISKESKYGNTIPVKTDFPNFTASYKNYGGMTGMDAEMKGQRY